MATALSYAPLFRQSIGFDRFNDLFENAVSEKQTKSTYPPYNIVKSDEHNYQIIMAIAGFSEKDINITLHNDTLKVSGKPAAEKADKLEFLYKGIAERSFEQSFRLADHMEVKDAKMENGILAISLLRNIPEAKKPRMIAINNV
ncbi:Small heat shock protein IbpA [Sinobacterium norvegicum]|uniref:Small heat shock protein IbpA n=1 Tax=Sinobacterium norvegicum TaxID=1641715 RepID=A0ABM9AD95_9GAMM|nr:Hsp20 family protein [Sinobacterium norvegicum]CAH0990973.1 Small heat shock protein IbpA [Sinobacterium norvegicum]